MRARRRKEGERKHTKKRARKQKTRREHKESKESIREAYRREQA